MKLDESPELDGKIYQHKKEKWIRLGVTFVLQLTNEG